ncbi:hypothetical protein NMG60_11030460 [Bertholletia excelsa]
MSSDLYAIDGTFFFDPFPPFPNSPIDSLLAPDNPVLQNPLDETVYLDQVGAANTIFSTSPPSYQLENLSLTHLQEAPNSATQFANFSSVDVKTEDCPVPVLSPYGYQNFGYGGTDNAAKMMQRSYSYSNSFEGKPNFLFQPRFDNLMESPGFQPQVMSSPENSFSGGQIRRVSSTGDLQMKMSQGSQRLSSSPLASESSFMEEANFKVGRYSAEERKERIHRYKAKRTQRNFNKTIKYACRKTLADNRPRIRGRFARNDETGEIPKTATFNRYEDEDDLWIEGLNEDSEEGGPLFNVVGSTQFQYYGY